MTYVIAEPCIFYSSDVDRIVHALNFHFVTARGFVDSCILARPSSKPFSINILTMRCVLPV